MENEYRPNVSHIGDLAHSPPDDILLVENNEDYVRACYAMANRDKSGTGLKIWVRSKSHFAWLKDFSGQIGCPAIFDEKTSRLVLAEKWNVRLPDWLTDSVVTDQGLLELDVDAKASANFEDRILAHFLGPAFRQDQLNAEHLADVVMALVADKAKAAFKKYDVLERCLRIKCERWADRSAEIWTNGICESLSEQPEEIWGWLSLWAGLHTYPEKLLEYVLAPKQAALVRKIPPEALDRLRLEPSAREQVENQIEIFFRDASRKIESGETFQKLVGRTSGRFSKEFFFISSILIRSLFSPSEEDIRMVREKFATCPGVSESQLNALSYHVKPERPSLPGLEEEWSGTEWIRWTTDQYVPYRKWQAHNSHFDPELENIAARFTDWYIREYVSIHKEYDQSLIHCLWPLSSDRAKNEFSIVLLIDCLPVEFMGLLDAALINVGFSRHDLHYRFAALPTVTEYNKASLLSGKWLEKPADYATILEARGVKDWGGRKVFYLKSLKEMSEMEPPKEAAVAVLNFTEGDELLHSDVESGNTTYEDELHRLFARVAEAASILSQKWTGPTEQVSVYVTTDHGACRILEEEKRSFDSKVVNKLFENEKHRFSAVDEDQMDEIPENLWELGRRFKRPFVSENVTFFLPRGHNTVRQSGKMKGYVHGGASPEEVIVPVAQYKLVKAAWKKPAARFLNLDLVRETKRAKFYIQRVVTLEIEIQNPNTSAVSVFRASILSPECDLKGFEPAVVRPKSANTVQISCYFKKSALGEKNLEIEIAYEIAGERHTLPLTLESEFKSAMASGFSLRDL